MELRYLVTGTGRSGTVFMARLLTSMGIMCGHESIFDWRGFHFAEKIFQDREPIHISLVSGLQSKDWFDSSQVEAESSYLAVPFLDCEYLKNTQIIHVVRHPIRVVNSFCNYIGYFSQPKPTNTYEHVIYRNVPELKDIEHCYDRCCWFCVKWNEKIEERSPHFFHRVESPVQSLAEFLGRDIPADVFSNRKANTFEKPGDRFSLDKIQDSAIRTAFVEMGERYGYTMSSEYLVL